MITIKKFIKQLDEGKITDFKQCIAELPNKKAMIEVACHYQNQTSINPEHLHAYIKRLERVYIGLGLSENFIQALKLKYEAETTPAPLLSTTMTTLQLFKMNNVHWTRGLTLRTIERIITWYDIYKEDKREELFYQRWEANGMHEFE